MSFEVWGLYFLAILVLIITPGPMAILNISTGLHYGGRRSFVTAIGGLTASLTMMTISACGLGAILAHSKTAFLLLQWAGGIYLFIMGIRAFTSKNNTLTANIGKGANASNRSLFSQAALMGISNPKELLFFGALFPQFMDMHAPQVPQLVILALTWSIVDLTCMIAYAFSAEYVSPWFKKDNKMRLFNRMSGTAYMGIAAAILAGAK